jgi:hypothetical protein
VVGVTWTKLGDTFAEEFEELGSDVIALHVAALCYCNRLLTDGQVPKRKASALFPVEDPELTIKVLVDAGYWAETATGYEIVDFFADQRSAETVLADREAARVRQANWRAAKKGGPKTNGQPSTASNKERNGVTNAVSHPYPAPPRPEGRWERGGAHSACGPRGALRHWHLLPE